MDGVDTIIRMATSGSDIGLSASSMISALLLTSLFVFLPLCIWFYADKFGYGESLTFAIVVYICVVLFSSQMDTPRIFYSYE